jgi:hypothetical protein
VAGVAPDFASHLCSSAHVANTVPTASAISARFQVSAPPTNRTSVAPPLPAELAEVVRHHLALTEQIEATLAAISAINLELLARRQLD